MADVNSRYCRLAGLMAEAAAYSVGYVQLVTSYLSLNCRLDTAKSAEVAGVSP
jgi:hypothetical protein